MHAVEKSTKAGFSHGAEMMMMHEEQQRGKACRVVRWRSGRARASPECVPKLEVWVKKFCTR